MRHPIFILILLVCSTSFGQQKTFQIFFNYNDSVPLKGYAELERFIKAHSPTSLTLIGHTDSIGTEERNIRLGLQRANEISDKIRRKNPGIQVLTQSKGESEPLGDNGSHRGKRLNRRVDVIVDYTAGATSPYEGTNIVAIDTREPLKTNKEEYGGMHIEDWIRSKEFNRYGEPIMPQALKPDLPETAKDPIPGCRVHFSGLVISDEFDEVYTSKALENDEHSNMVGKGAYPKSTAAFPDASRATFDGIAVDEGTRLIIFSDRYYRGDTLLDVTGPAIINNTLYKPSNSHKVEKEFNPELEKMFARENRIWSETNMNSWQNGSVKIGCPGKK